MERDISLTGGGPWGFTLSGGKDFGAPLKVSKITAGGKAAKGGIKFGDYIWEINSDTTVGLLHSDAMMLIKTTGVTLNLKVSKEIPSSGDATASAAESVPSGDRPRPPPVPQTTATSSPVQKTTIVVPKKATEQPPPVPAYIAADATDDVHQSPAFKRITIQNRPTVFKQPPPSSPPTQQMKNIVIDDGSVLKTSQKPASPKTTTSATKRDPPIARPPPPATASSGGTTQVGGQSAAPAGGGKVVERQGVCEACQQPIRGPYAAAMGKVWHTEHFVCSSCDKSMQNASFIFEEEKIFCEECYQSKFAQTCHTCKKPIVGAIISAVGLHWHQEHFACSRCNADLSKGSGFNMDNNLLFCVDCFSSLYGSSCHGCGQRIAGDELWVEALDHTWHPACFVCETCQRPLEGTTFFNRMGRPCCKDCV